MKFKIKGLITSLLLLISFQFFSQTVNEIELLKNRKNNFEELIENYKDSISLINKKLLAIEGQQYLNQLGRDKGVIIEVEKGAKIKIEPHILSNDLTRLSTQTKVLMIDYSDGFAKVIFDDSVGWIYNSKIISRNEYDDFRNFKAQANEKNKEMENQNQKKVEREKLISKYGKKTTAKLESGLVWIGMTEEMAKISWGRPIDINQTIFKDGTVTKQYVYSYDSYLYFRNGKLETIQK